MEKKNTMLLTVIAVATLLVAVVGATFAYFAITADTTGVTNSVITTETSGVGTVVFASDVTAMKLELTSADMAKDAAPKNYYAVKESEFNTDTKRWVEGPAQNHNILKVTATNTKSDKYDCTGTLTVKLAATTANTHANLAALTNADGEVTLNSADTTLTIASNAAMGLKDLYDAGTAGITKNITITGLTSSPAGVVTNLVTADLLVKNLSEVQQQTQLAEAGFTVTITPAISNCEVAQ